MRWTIVLAAVLGLVASGCSVGATWTPQAVEPALPASPDRIVLSDVACPADGACVAVGRRTTTAGETLILRQAGSTWQVLAAPFQLLDLQPEVTCRGVDDCIVVGTPLDLHVGPAGVTVVPPAPGTPEPSGQGTMSCVAAGCLRVNRADLVVVERHHVVDAGDGSLRRAARRPGPLVHLGHALLAGRERLRPSRAGRHLAW